MALAYNMRRTTADVDGVFEPKAVIYEAARRVADRKENQNGCRISTTGGVLF